MEGSVDLEGNVRALANGRRPQKRSNCTDGPTLSANHPAYVI
jgi:hypothetical protein